MFYYQYIAEIPEIIETEGEKITLSSSVAGSILHKALELYNDEEFDAVLAKKIFRRAVNVLDVDESTEIDRLELVFLEYKKSNISKKVYSKVVKECPFTVPLEDHGIKNRFTSGQIDKIIFSSDGSLEIIDYKSGSLKDNFAPELAYKVQLVI